MTTPLNNPGNPTYSLADLRFQILANGSILCPRPSNVTTNTVDTSTINAAGGQTAGPHDHLELVVVKKEFSNAPKLPVVGAKTTTTAVKAAETKKAMSEARGLWYATLLKRTGSTNALRIVVKGEGQEEIGKALEVLLEETGKRIDRLMRAYGREL